MLAIDVSNYTTGFNARALAQVGVKRAIVQVVNERILTHREQIPALLEAGIETEAYVYQWFSGGEEFIRRRMTWALDELAAFPDVRRVWLDCEQGEDDNPPYGGGLNTTEMIRLAVTLAGERGYEVGIYTAKWWWDRYQHGVTAFSMLPLWVAQYDGEQSTAIVPFGGWQRAEMKQYAGKGEIAGVGGIDFNWYEEDDVIRILTSQSEAVEVALGALGRLSGAIGQQEGQYVAVSDGAPAGYRDVVIRVKE